VQPAAAPCKAAQRPVCLLLSPCPRFAPPAAVLLKLTTFVVMTAAMIAVGYLVWVLVNRQDSPPE